jgi:hypothetical protein
MVIWSNFRKEDPQILDAAVQNTAVWATRRPAILQPCF